MLTTLRRDQVRMKVEKDYNKLFNSNSYQKLQHELTSIGLYTLQFPLFIAFAAQPFLKHKHVVKAKAVVRPIMMRKDSTVSWPGVGLAGMLAVGSLWLLAVLVRRCVAFIVGLLY